MRVSVVIPVFNEEKYIKDCLVSLQNQVEKATEILVVDNNSRDKTIEIARRFPVKILKEETQGIIHARDKGFDSAQYEIIARCDADSRLPKNWIKKIKKNFSSFKIDALTGPAVFFDLPLKTTLYTKTYFDLFKIFLGKETLFGSNMAITKSIWDKVRTLVCKDDSKVHEDIDLGLHIVSVGGKIRRDNTLVIKAAGRRIKHNPSSFFVEYPLRLMKTIKYHTSQT